MLTNYHCHSHYCDGKGPLEEYVTAAITKGMDAIGFSSHCPLPFFNEWSMKKDLLDQYLSEIQLLKSKYSTQITIHTSLEVDYIKSIVGPGDFKSLLEYTIGSIHYLGQFADETHFEVDGSTQVFKKGLEEIYNNDINQFLTAYFEAIREMAKNDKPDIIGHLDKIKVHNETQQFWDENSEIYINQLKDTLRTIAREGIIVEVNTRGLYKKRCRETYPGMRILKEMRNLSIPVTINSDSHHPDELISSYEFAMEVLKEAGYKESHHFIDRKWVSVSLG